MEKYEAGAGGAVSGSESGCEKQLLPGTLIPTALRNLIRNLAGGKKRDPRGPLGNPSAWSIEVFLIVSQGVSQTVSQSQGGGGISAVK